MSTQRLRPLAASLRASSSLPTLPHPLHLTPSIRALSTRAPLSASYRRFGDPPRGSVPPPPPPRREADEKEAQPNPLEVLLANLPRRGQQQQQISPFGQAFGGRGGRGAGGSGRRQGFSFHNAKQLAKSPIFIVVAAGGSTYYVIHLEKVPETGRWRFMDVSKEMEQQMGEQGYQEVMQEYRSKLLPDGAPQARYVQEVVKRIVRANGLEKSLGEGKGFVTHVVNEPQTKNAFVLPNGAIFVFTGILDVANDPDSLAAVLGHEIAHQVARHSAERMSGTKVLYGLSLLLSSLGIDFGISQVLLNLTMSLPNSRTNETEADKIGLQLANKACYDPRAAEGLWQRMGAAEESPGVDMSFLSTHPSSKNRTVQVAKWANDIVKERPDHCGALKEQVPAFQRVAGSRWS